MFGSYARPAALTAVYLVWGSTYLAIALAVKTLPPLLMAGSRFIVAGALMLAWLRATGTALPDKRQWVAALLVGTLLLLGGNGTVCLVAHAVPSGIVALIIACTTLAMVGVGWACGGPRPTARLSLGILLGLLGVAFLVWRPGSVTAAAYPWWGIAALLGACLSWAAGSVLSRRLAPAARIPSPWMATAAQMLAGGTVVVLAGLVDGEWARCAPSGFSAVSLAAWAYLVVGGSIIGFGSYVWLLRHASPALATSYGYVNPLVAIVLGAWLNHEPVNGQMLWSAAIILSAVALIATAAGQDGPLRNDRDA
jgi:drug/metabolite transporter (DMT)-like permease